MILLELLNSVFATAIDVKSFEMYTKVYPSKLYVYNRKPV